MSALWPYMCRPCRAKRRGRMDVPVAFVSRNPIGHCAGHRPVAARRAVGALTICSPAVCEVLPAQGIAVVSVDAAGTLTALR